MTSAPSESHFSDSTKSEGRHSPVRALLTQQAEGVLSPLSRQNSADRSSFDMFGGQSEISDFSIQHSSLKDLIEAATGVPAQCQKLVIGRRGMLVDAKKSLYQYDVGHGALVYLSIRNAGTRNDVRFLASPRLKEETDMHGPMNQIGHFMKSKTMMGTKVAKEIVEPLHMWHVSLAHEPSVAMSRSSEMYYQDYTFLRDNHIFDLAGRIRKKFNHLTRVSAAKQRELQCLDIKDHGHHHRSRPRGWTSEGQEDAPRQKPARSRTKTGEITRANSKHAKLPEAMMWREMLHEEKIFEHDHPDAEHLL